MAGTVIDDRDLELRLMQVRGDGDGVRSGSKRVGHKITDHQQCIIEKRGLGRIAELRGELGGTAALERRGAAWSPSKLRWNC